MKWLIKPILLLVITSLFLFGYVLHRQSEVYRDIEMALQSLQWMLLICLVAWCGVFLLLDFSEKDWSLITLLILAVSIYFISQSEYRSALDALVFLGGVTLGKGVSYVLKCGRQRTENGNTPDAKSQKPDGRVFLIGLVVLLALASWWHLGVAHMFYPGTRWTGLWNNPNAYGELMSVGVVLTVGLLTDRRWKTGVGKTKQKAESGKQKVLAAILFIVALMTTVGLVKSYSRGSWLGTAAGLLYLAWFHGKLKWRYVLPVVIAVAAVVLFFWNTTPDSAPWFVKRMDFGRASAQHRVAAWRAGFEIMWNHPFGVGWNRVVEVYQNSYLPPEGGAAAITTNDYLILGTQLGWLGVICFVVYVAVSLELGRREKETCRLRKPEVECKQDPRTTLDDKPRMLDAARVACRASASAMLVGFWFDGGLFNLPTATAFWILLELGSHDVFSRNQENQNGPGSENRRLGERGRPSN